MDKLIRGLDDTLAECERFIKPLAHLEPQNEAEQKEAFVDGNIRNPHFTYKPLAYDTRSIAERLVCSNARGGELVSLFESKREELLLKNMLIANRDDKDLVQEVTSNLYGTPDRDLVSYAETLLGEVTPTENSKEVSAEEMRYGLQEALVQYGLAGWGVRFSEKRRTTVNPAESMIDICGGRQFSINEKERQKVHEIGVHALRSANGYEQPLRILRTGLAGYITTEEGLGLYAEELTDTMDTEALRDYAARVIAVDSVCQGNDFRQTYERLRDHDLSAEQAWQLGVRVHRGGGYVKDHIYLRGLQRVRQFAEENGDFETLYAGKMGIEHYQQVSGLIEEGVLRRPAYVPEVLTKPHRVR